MLYWNCKFQLANIPFGEMLREFHFQKSTGGSSNFQKVAGGSKTTWTDLKWSRLQMVLKLECRVNFSFPSPLLKFCENLKFQKSDGGSRNFQKVAGGSKTTWNQPAVDFVEYRNQFSEWIFAYNSIWWNFVGISSFKNLLDSPELLKTGWNSFQSIWRVENRVYPKFQLSWSIW